MPKDYLEQLEEDKQLLYKMITRIVLTVPETEVLERAIERLDKEIKHVKWCRCQ